MKLQIIVTNSYKYDCNYEMPYSLQEPNSSINTIQTELSLSKHKEQLQVTFQQGQVVNIQDQTNSYRLIQRIEESWWV